MKIASIDIGTNAIKSKIFKTTPASIEFVQGIRSPIRLGGDVFNKGNLSEAKLDQVIETIREYEAIFKKNSISHYEIVATSAFRDTSNSEDARRYIETAINHPLRVISGLEEAKIIKYKKKFDLAEIFAGSMDNLFGNRTIKIGINATATDNDFPRFMYLWTGYQQNYLFKWPAFN